MGLHFLCLGNLPDQRGGLFYGADVPMDPNLA